MKQHNKSMFHENNICECRITFDEHNAPHDGPNPAKDKNGGDKLKNGGHETNDKCTALVPRTILSLRSEYDRYGCKKCACKNINSFSVQICYCCRHYITCTVNECIGHLNNWS